MYATMPLARLISVAAVKPAKGGPEPELFVEIDVTSDESVKAAFERVRNQAGDRASFCGMEA